MKFQLDYGSETIDLYASGTRVASLSFEDALDLAQYLQPGPRSAVRDRIRLARYLGQLKEKTSPEVRPMWELSPTEGVLLKWGENSDCTVSHSEALHVRGFFVEESEDSILSSPDPEWIRFGEELHAAVMANEVISRRYGAWAAQHDEAATLDAFFEQTDIDIP